MAAMTSSAYALYSFVDISGEHWLNISICERCFTDIFPDEGLQ